MERLNLDAPSNESLLGSMATLRMPGGGVGRSAARSSSSNKEAGVGS